MDQQPGLTWQLGTLKPVPNLLLCGWWIIFVLLLLSRHATVLTPFTTLVTRTVSPGHLREWPGHSECPASRHITRVFCGMQPHPDMCTGYYLIAALWLESQLKKRRRKRRKLRRMRMGVEGEEKRKWSQSNSKRDWGWKSWWSVLMVSQQQAEWAWSRKSQVTGINEIRV